MFWTNQINQWLSDIYFSEHFIRYFFRKDKKNFYRNSLWNTFKLFFQTFLVSKKTIWFVHGFLSQLQFFLDLSKKLSLIFKVFHKIFLDFFLLGNTPSTALKENSIKLEYIQRNFANRYAFSTETIFLT